MTQPPELSFWDHLDQLRSVLLKSLGAWVAGAVVAFCLKDLLFGWLFAPASPDFVLYRVLPLSPDDMRVSFLNTEITGQFMTHMQVSLWAGLVLAFPLMTYWLYGFIAPALYEQERHYSLRLMLLSALLFAAGVCLSYFLIFPLSFRFLNTYQVTDIVVNQISLTSYISLFLVLSLLMGILFEIPVLTWFLSRTGIINAAHLRRFRRHVFVAILIFAAIITPTGDPFTLLLVTIPVYLLYELSIHICA